MIPLRQLLSVVSDAIVSGDTNVSVEGITSDSRQVGPGWAFVAVRGISNDGHDFISSAIDLGASVIIAETAPPLKWSGTWVHVARTQDRVGLLAAAFYGDPSKRMKVTGITGTNGKTTIAFLIRHLCESAQRRCGLMGTVFFSNGQDLTSATHTTPDAVSLQRLLAEMRDNDCRCAAMEVSSHALHQSRTAGVAFDVAVFTNLTQDHLDYHGNMDDYFAAKSLLFSQTVSGEKSGTLIINVDDAYGEKLARNWSNHPKVVRYGMGLGANFRIGQPQSNVRGSTFSLEVGGRQFLVRMPLIGKFNVANATAALAAAHAMGLNLREAVKNLAEAPQVPGRLEAVTQRLPFQIFVDYAHTPDALENVLRTVRELNPRRLIVVAGCGGNRDRSKRPQMAAVCERLADMVMLTSDNPRDEDPDDILDDMERGMKGRGHARVADRREAIRQALESARPRDAVVICGKGHETYQEVEGVKQPFDDRVVSRQILQQMDMIP